MNKGLLLVVSGPSGCGKGTVCEQICKKHPEIKVSVSATTRDKRVGEEEGKTYFFRTREQFEAMIANGEMLEHAQVYGGNYYGTPKKYVTDHLEAGNDVILEIDIQGALKVKDKFPEGVFIFLVPPTMEELYRRLVCRGRETAELIMERFEAAYQEINFMDRYNYVVVNDTVSSAVSKVEAIIIAEKCSIGRNQELNARLTEKKEKI